MSKKSGTSEQENESPIRPRLVSVQQAAYMLGLHVNTIRKMEIHGQLPSVRQDGFSASRLIALIAGSRKTRDEHVGRAVVYACPACPIIFLKKGEKDGG
jgi:hypothetical protein